jgi:hypothetical protein
MHLIIALMVETLPGRALGRKFTGINIISLSFIIFSLICWDVLLRLPSRVGYAIVAFVLCGFDTIADVM